jgi:hypothetical protein
MKTLVGSNRRSTSQRSRVYINQMDQVGTLHRISSLFCSTSGSSPLIPASSFVWVTSKNVAHYSHPPLGFRHPLRFRRRERLWTEPIPVGFSRCRGEGCADLSDLAGPLKICVFLPEDRPILPTLPRTRTAPAAGHGTLDRAVVLLTSLRPTSLLLSAITTGTGPTARFAATLPRPPPPPPSHLLHLAPLGSPVMKMATPLDTDTSA